MARTSAVAGFLFLFLFLGAPFGVLTLYYSRKGLKQRQAANESTAGVRVTAVFGLIELIGGVGSWAFGIWSLMK